MRGFLNWVCWLSVFLLPGLGTARQDAAYYRNHLLSAGDSLWAAGDQWFQPDTDSLAEDPVEQDLLGLYHGARSDAETAAALERLGNHYRDKGDVFRALDRYLRALETDVDAKAQARISREVGLLYAKIKEFDESVEFLNRSVSLFKETGDAHSSAETMQRLAQIHRGLGSLDLAEQHLEEAEDLHDDVDSTRHQAQSLNALGELHLQQGIHDEALQFFELAAQLNALMADRDNHVDTQHGLAKINLNRGRLASAENQAREALQHAHVNRDFVDLRDIYATLTEILRRMDRFEEAIITLQRHFEYVDSVAGAERKVEMQLMASKVGYEQEKSQLLAAQAAREAVLQEEIYKQRLLLGTVGLLFLVALAVSVIAIRKGRETRAMNSLMQAKGMEIMEQKLVLEEQTVQLNETMAMKDRLLSIIAHDLRSPLASLSGILELAEQGGIDESEFREWLPQIRRTMESNSTMLDNLLLWARQQWKGDGAIQKENVDLQELLRRKVELFGPVARSKSISLSQQTIAETKAYADPAMLDVVAHNLISNAIKFTPVGGNVVVGAQNTGRNAEIFVTDTGVGMSPDEMAKLFGAGSKTKEGTAREKGTGLGLVVCRDFVEANQGTISVQSEPGKGSQFTVTLPAQG